MGKRDRLLGLCKALLAEYGPQGWWPVRHTFSDPRFEIIIGAILTQGTAWTNVEKALDGLERASLTSPARILDIASHKLALCIRSSGYYNQKARKLKAFCAMLEEEYRGDLNRLCVLPVDCLRRRLLNLFGIGPETADSIILYAAQKPVFVIDAYTRRFVAAQRLTTLSSYTALQQFFESALPKRVTLFQEFHALIVRWGKERARIR